MDHLEKLGIERVVNASGRMTALGVNTLSEDVLSAMAAGASDYVDIACMKRTVGHKIAELIGAEDAMITTGAAAGVALMVAACIAGNDVTRVQALPDPMDRPNQILIQNGHQVNFGAPIVQLIRMGGGVPHPLGSVNSVSEAHLAGALQPSVAAFLYVQSHHTVQKGTIPLSRCIEICRDSDVPVLVDAAAEEDLRRYTTGGASLVTFSGGKAIGGPTSGIVAGQADLVEACRAQEMGIGRPMKIGKETLVGLFAAVETYLHRDEVAEQRRCSTIVDKLLAGFAPVAKTERLIDEAGRRIERAGILLDPDQAHTFVQFLRKGTPPIVPRTHLLNQGIVAFDPRPLKANDVPLIVERVREYFASQQSASTQ